MKDRKASENIRYRRMTAEDIAAVHKLSLSVLWPHRLEDWKFIQELGMGIVAEVDAGVLGTAMCWVHGSEYASIGMLIVSPDRQREGIGRELVSRALKEAGNRNVLLHASASGLSLCESFGFFDLHGTSACALALTTDDPAAALARAEALGCTRLSGQTNAGELDIPAVSAPDGSLLYFCGPAQGPRQRFESDFTIDARADQALRRRGAPLLPVPDNYYDDLAAKYEFVERRGGYELYGSTNSPVRLAALAEWRAAHEVGNP